MHLQLVPEGTVFWGQSFRGWYYFCDLELTYSANRNSLKWHGPSRDVAFTQNHHILIFSHLKALCNTYCKRMDGCTERNCKLNRARRERKTDKTQEKNLCEQLVTLEIMYLTTDSKNWLIFPWPKFHTVAKSDLFGVLFSSGQIKVSRSHNSSVWSARGEEEKRFCRAWQSSPHWLKVVPSSGLSWEVTKKLLSEERPNLSERR